MEHAKASSSSCSPFLSRLSSIPIFADSKNFLQSYSPRLLTDAFNKASDLTQKYLPPSLLSRVDKLGNALLAQLEHSFPAIKKPTEEIIARPKAVYEKVVTRPIVFVHTAADTYAAAGKERAGAVKENLYGSYKTYAEPTIGEYTNDYVRKVNDYFEGAMETKKPKSHSETAAETTNGEGRAGEGRAGAGRAGEGKAGEGGSGEGGAGGGEADGGIELYRSARLARNAVEWGRVKIFVPLKNMVGKTIDDVKEGGQEIKTEIRGLPAKVRDGVNYMWKIMDEEMEREKGKEGRVGVKGAVKVGYRVSERYAGEVVGVGLVVVARVMGVILGIWEVGRKKAKMA